jgi:hypothetical protein
MPTILTDVDEVLLKWKPTFDRFLEDQHGIKVPENYRNKRVDEWLGEKTWDYVNQFNGDPTHFSCLPAYEDAALWVPRLHQEGWTLIAITAAGRNDAAFQMRQANLKSQFGDIFDDLHHVDYEEGKDCWLEKYHPTWWIDDSWTHILTGLKYNHNCIHMVRYWDSEHFNENVARAGSWEDVYRIVNQ